ncbi:MAG: chemotaxis protein CheB [Myxococcaceae bacterium]
MPSRKTPYRVLMVDRGLRLSDRAAPLFASGALAPSGPGCDYVGMPDAVEQQGPDVIVVEISPDEEAITAIEAVMAERPTPILVLHPHGSRKMEAFEALALGALDVEEYPNTLTAEFWKQLTHKVALLAQVRVVQHIRGKRRRRFSAPSERASAGPTFPVVAIAASLGGPRALSLLLRNLPKDFGAPICICQHISEGFATGLAQWLASETHVPITEARNGEQMVPGHVYVAPSSRHLLLQANGKLRLDDSAPLMGFRPSCDALLSSAAQAFGRRAIGVVLTGMGRDGARGLKEIRRKGGHTIAQDEATCVVYGMPREAVELGAAEHVLALEAILPMLVKWVEPC